MNMEQLRLTGEDIMEAELAWEADKGSTPLGYPGWIADAATEKALRAVLVWLRKFELRGDIAFWRRIRGIGLDMAAGELEAMLEAAGGS